MAASKLKSLRIRVDHLVLGTSLPWLLPHALGDLQAINQIAANRSGWRGWLAEKIRQGADLEHWQAFHDSFERFSSETPSTR